MKVKTTKYPKYRWYHRVLRIENSDKKFKIKVGKNDWDVDRILSHIIPPLVRNLKKIQHGSPIGIDDTDLPEELRLNREPGWIDDYYDDLLHRQWDWILDKIVWGFKQTQNDWSEEFCNGEIDLSFKDVGEPDNNGNKKMVIVYGPNHTFKRDDEGIKKRQEEIEKARRLFAKYFDFLVD